MTFNQYRDSVERHLSEIFNNPVKLDWLDVWTVWLEWLCGVSVHESVESLIEVSYIDEEEI